MHDRPRWSLVAGVFCNPYAYIARIWRKSSSRMVELDAMAMHQPADEMKARLGAEYARGNKAGHDFDIWNQ